MLIVKKETRARKTNVKGDEALHLVLYQGSQWRNDDGNPLGDESRQLVAQTLAASCNKMHPLDQLALTHFTQASAIAHSTNLKEGRLQMLQSLIQGTVDVLYCAWPESTGKFFIHTRNEL